VNTPSPLRERATNLKAGDPDAVLVGQRYYRDPDDGNVCLACYCLP